MMQKGSLTFYIFLVNTIWVDFVLKVSVAAVGSGISFLQPFMTGIPSLRCSIQQITSLRAAIVERQRSAVNGKIRVTCFACCLLELKCEVCMTGVIVVQVFRFKAPCVSVVLDEAGEWSSQANGFDQRLKTTTHQW